VEVVAGAGGVVSSPPFEGVVQHDGGPVLQQGGAMHSAYGTTPGQLGNMPAGVVSSPPYEVTPIAAFDSGVKASGGLGKQFALGNNPGGQSQVGTVGYGDSPGNIANDNANTFWQAAAVIVQQCYDILRPGGYAAWVTDDFVRNKQRVPFGEQWLALCGKVGFEPVLWAVAWKAQHNGTQHGIFGDAQELRKTKVSFFRRMANQKRPDTAIENEDVIFVRKPS
jgi:hypothetical protein